MATKITRYIPSIPATLSKLDSLRKEITSAKSYEAIKRVEREALALKLLFSEVEAVKQKAEIVILVANRRIAGEIEKVPTAKPGPKAITFPRGNLIAGREAIGIPKATRSRLKKLLSITEKEMEKRANRIHDHGGDATPRALITTIRLDEIKGERATYDARAEQGGKVSDLVDLAKTGQRFRVIYADPPWDVKTYSDKGQQKSAQRHYRTMPIDEMCTLPIEQLCEESCVLLMWIVAPLLPQSLEVIKQWGFTYKTIGFNWVKQSKKGNGFAGLGFWTRAGSEICLLATRGKPKRMAADVMQVIQAPVGKHSEKPEEARRRIERLVLGPYLELFARRPVNAWWTWGNEVAKPSFKEAAE